MDRYEIIYLPSAQGDLLDIFDYVKRDRPEAANRLLQLVDEAIGRVADFPWLGREPRDERLQQLGYRILVVDNYLIFYVVKSGHVEIRRVIHGRRRYEFLLE
ncbi:MAG: type II toxin-antitoxin system RelE/ParE family toxin [Bacillota bacterium]